MEKQSSLSELIANKASVGSIPILELATALSSPSARRSLKLPAFQRDAVWDEDRLSTLWDSLLRGYPIGSLILCPAGGFIGRQISSRAAQSSLRQQAHQSHELAEGELLILDGQQRSIAIALGFRLPVEGLTERLWIDLEPKEELSSGARFYLCTALRPWGAKVPFDSPEELSALEALQLANRREFQKNNDAMLLQSYPLHACLPVPMAEWLDAVARDRVFDPPQLAYIHPDLRNLYVKKSAELSAAIAAMHLQIKQLRQQVIPLQIVYSLQTIDDLSVAFSRLNSQGVTMGADDLFYSALKMQWPAFHDVVWEIFGNVEFGRILSPLRIVHLSIRIAMSQSGKVYEDPESDDPDEGTDVVALNARAYKRLFSGNRDRVTALIHRLTYLHEGGSHSAFSRTLVECRKAILFDPDLGPDDPGLPLPLVAQLDWHFWHLAAAIQFGKASIGGTRRIELIRLALYMHFFFGRGSVRVREAIRRKAFRTAMLINSRSDAFQEIYRTILNTLTREEKAAFYLIDPGQYCESYDAQKFPNFAEPLKNAEAVLLYVQRKWVHDWYQNYDPAAFQRSREDTPYDFDHILPVSSIKMGGKRNVPEDFWKDTHFSEILRTSIGNFRVWPKELNRSDQDLPPATKMDLAGISADITGRLATYGLKTADDLLTASAIPQSEAGQWKSISGEKDYWFVPAHRVAFKSLVMKRAISLFERTVGPAELLSYIPLADDVKSD